MGPIEPNTVEKVQVKITDEEKARLERFSKRPPLDEILNLHDFEVGKFLNIHILFSFQKAIARQVMPEKAWAYYSSAADDEITIRENHAAYHRYVSHRMVEMDDSHQTSRIWFRPHILIDVTKVDWSTTVLGHRSSMPVYIVRPFDL